MIVLVLLLILAGCVSGPQMPVEPFRCFDSDGHEIPCVDEMDCHEEKQDSVKEQASYSGCMPTCSKDGSVCLSDCAGGVL
jgi:hypothetical protein